MCIRDSDDNLLVPFFLPPKLNGRQYIHFLQTNLMELLKDIPVGDRVQLWFLNNGAFAHYCRNVMNHLNNTFTKQWICRNGPVKWPPQSPDLTPENVFLWGWTKSLVYSACIGTQQELRQCVIEAGATVKNNPVSYTHLDVYKRQEQERSVPHGLMV